MADDNRPQGRKTNVTGQGKGVYKRGEGLGTGKVGSGGTVPGGPQKPQEGGQSQQSSGRATGTRAGGKLPLLLIIAVLLLGGGGGLSGLFGNLLGGSSSTVPATQTPVSQPAQTQSSQGSSLVSNLLSLSGLPQVSNAFSGSNASGLLPGTAPASSWSIASNNGKLNRNVASEARKKYTTIKGNGKDTVTIMVYMCGADLESRSGMATNDLKEMASATLSDKVNIIVYTGGCSSWKVNGISNSVNQIYKIQNGGLKQLDANAGNGAMTNPDTLESFIKYGAKNYPANRQILIFWDHGGGSISGYGYDETHKNAGSMSLAQINQALKGAGQKFDFIGFDTCLMATAENALMLSNYADYMVASEETEPGVGWYYTNWLTELSKNTSMPTVEIGQKICDDFVDVCAQQCRGQKTTLSVVDLAELSKTFGKVFTAFSKDTKDLIASDDYKTVSNARSNTREFSTSSIDQIDLVHFASLLGTDEAKALADTLLGAVKYNRMGNMTNAYGLSIYFPYRTKSTVNQADKIYSSIGLDDEYTDCIKEFAGMATAGQVASSSPNSPFSLLSGLGNVATGGQSAEDIGQLLNLFLGSSGTGDLTSLLTGRSLSLEDTAAYIEENHFDASKLVWQLYEDEVYRIVLDQDQWDLVQGLDMNMFYDDGEGFIDLGLDNVYEFDDKGHLTGNYDGSWLSINDQPVAYYHVSTSEEGGDYVMTGRVPCMINGERMDLIIIFTGEQPYGYVAGAQPAYVEGETETVSRGLYELQKGDKIDFLCDYYEYDGTYSDSYMLGDQLVVDGELTVSNTYVGGDVLVLFRFTDIYGQNYWTDPVPAE